MLKKLKMGIRKKGKPSFLFSSLDGFTMIEMLVVIAILGIISFMSVAAWSNQDAPHMAKVRKGIVALHNIKKGLESMETMCGGRVYITGGFTAGAQANTAFKDLMCNNRLTVRVWPEVGCGSGDPANNTQLPGLQNFIDEVIFTVGASDCSTVAASPGVQGSEMDSIFNAEEVDPSCSSSACTGLSNIAACPFHNNQGYTVATQVYNAGLPTNNKLAGPNTVICGVVQPKVGWRVLVLMNKDGLGRTDLAGNALPSACATGPWCQQFKNGATTSGCCDSLGYRW